jgi:hypothetical protein
LHVDRTRDLGAIMLSAKHHFEKIEYGTAGEATTRPLRGDAALPLVEHGFALPTVAGQGPDEVTKMQE